MINKFKAWHIDLIEKFRNIQVYLITKLFGLVLQKV